MQEFTKLNGYGVKDATARAAIATLEGDIDAVETGLSAVAEELEEVKAAIENGDEEEVAGIGRITPQMFGAVGDGVNDDTAAIQAALDTGEDVYFLNGKYRVCGPGLVVNKNNQKLVFDGNAWIEADTMETSYVLLIRGEYNKLYDVKIRLTDTIETVNAIQVGGEREFMSNTVKQIGSGTTLKMGINTATNLYGNASSPAAILQCEIDGVAYKMSREWFAAHPELEFIVEPVDGAKFSFNAPQGSINKNYTAKTVIDSSNIPSGGGSNTEALRLNLTQGAFYNVMLVKKDPQDINNPGFCCHLYDCTTTGTGLCGLYVNGLETRVYGGKFRGTKYGINIVQPDFYGENIYCEQCTADGFRANVGSIEAHHIHSYNNGNKGFHLTGVNFSNFYGIYADKNKSDGIYMNGISGEVNVFGGWSYYSGYETGTQSSFDWNFQDVRDVSLYGCRSNQGNENKAGSYNVSAGSRIYFYGCMAYLDPQIKTGGIARFTNCHANLRKYNSDYESVRSDKVSLLPGEEANLDVRMDLRMSELSMASFEVYFQFKATEANTGGSYEGGFTRWVLATYQNGDGQFYRVMDNPESDWIRISYPDIFDNDTFVKLRFPIRSEHDYAMDASVTVNLLSCTYL